jgi:hypothetical protein
MKRLNSGLDQRGTDQPTPAERFEGSDRQRAGPSLSPSPAVMFLRTTGEGERELTKTTLQKNLTFTAMRVRTIDLKGHVVVIRR